MTVLTAVSTVQVQVITKHLQRRRVTATHEGATVKDLGDVKRAVTGAHNVDAGIVLVYCSLHCLDGLL